MIDPQIIFALIGIALGVVGYFLYFRSIFNGQTKPHLFTWFVYFIVDIIVFSAQTLKGGGPGTWVTFTGLIGTFCVSVLAVKFGEKHIRIFDWLSFTMALIAVAIWAATGNPLYSVIISAIINFLAMAPTFRKAYTRPDEESISIWAMDAVRFSFSIAALSIISLTTALFPAALITGNILLIVMIMFRRHKLKRV